MEFTAASPVPAKSSDKASELPSSNSDFLDLESTTSHSSLRGPHHRRPLYSRIAEAIKSPFAAHTNSNEAAKKTPATLRKPLPVCLPALWRA